MTCPVMAELVGIAPSSIHHILTNILGKRKIVAKWIPHLLSEEQRQARRIICSSHFWRHRREGDGFLQRIIACDETWAYAYHPELKRQSAEWRSPDSPRPVKAIREWQLSRSCTFFDYQGVICDHAVPPNHTVNGEYYLHVLHDFVRPAIRRKRPELLETVILLQDNAAPH